MKTLSDLFDVLVYYIKFMIPVMANIFIWIGLDAISSFKDRGIFVSGIVITSLMWILSVFLKEIKSKVQ